MKSRLILIILIFSLLLSNTACRKDKETNTNDDSAAATDESNKDIDLSFLELTSYDISAWGVFGEDLLDSFARIYPEIKVTVEPVVNFMESDKTVDLTRLGGSIASNDQPDVFEGVMTTTEAYYSNLFDPIQEYLELDPNYNLKDIEENYFREAIFNDKIYFIPDTNTSDVLVWNKQLFEQVGLDPEKPPETWDEYLYMCEKLVTYDSSGKIATVGHIPSRFLFNAFDWDHWHVGAYGQEAHYVDKTRLNINWNTPEYQKTFEIIRDIRDKTSLKGDIDENTYNFFKGNTGFIHWNCASLPVISAGVNFDYGFTTMPKLDKDANVNISSHIGSFYAFPKGAKNRPGGYKLATYKLTDGAVDMSMKLYNDNPNNYIPGFLAHRPSREKLYDILKPIMDEKQYNNMVERDSIEINRNITYYNSPVETDMLILFNKLYPKVMKNEMAITDFLNQLQDYGEVLIEDFKTKKTEEGWIFEEGSDGRHE